MHAQRNESRVDQMIQRLRQRWCSHAFAIEDIMILRDVPQERRAKWPCAKCGKVFEGDGGMIAISDAQPARVFQRNAAPNP